MNSKIHMNIASIHSEKGEIETAKLHYEIALENLISNFGENYIENAEIYKNIGLSFFHLNKY